MSGVFQNIDPPPPHRLASVYPRLCYGGGHTRWVERGVGGGQQFGRRQTLLCTLCKYFVGHLNHAYLPIDASQFSSHTKHIAPP
jgi:hypothetical protein